MPPVAGFAAPASDPNTMRSNLRFNLRLSKLVIRLVSLIVTSAPALTGALEIAAQSSPSRVLSRR
jgi:hypothetical protein